MVIPEYRDRELAPIEIVARELSISIPLIPRERISEILKRLLSRSMGEAHSLLLSSGEDGIGAVEEYLVLAECIVAFGSTIAALEDIEREGLS